MLRKILRVSFTIIGMTIGFYLGTIALATEFLSSFKESMIKSIGVLAIISLVCGLILYLLFPWIYKNLRKLMDYIEKNMQKLSAMEIIFGAVGAILFLVISALVFSVLSGVPRVGKLLYAVINIIMAVLGADLAIKKKDEILNALGSFKKVGSSKDKKVKHSYKGTPKVLDTSVIIDGRIADLCKTGFIEGTLVIPNFVLEELRHIADSSDGLKRNRGRRGLDILNKIQKELDIDVEISEKDFPDIAEVDSKLLKLAQVLGGKVITNDYNLNKVAEFQGVPVLNINELANAIKPVLLPGEEMRIQIIKDGKESGQGVAYLDDGTMIVVEGGRKHIGEDLDVIVTSVLQTPAGRMIFAKEK